MLDYIIVANGNFLVREIILEAIKNKVIIALDGAASKLNRLGIKPNIILGDFDSITESDRSYFGIRETFADLEEGAKPYLGNHDVTIVPAKDQQHTDLVKAIRYCNKIAAKSINIICATGGMLDQHESAIRALRTEYNKNCLIWLHTEQQTVRFAKNETVVILGEVGDKCGILAFPSGSFTSTGLKYEVKNYPLEFGQSESICNSLTASSASIVVKGEALLIMPPRLSSQRNFMQKSEVERLELLLRDMRIANKL